MIGAWGRSRRTWARRWVWLIAFQILLCIGTCLVSLVLPEEPNPVPGYYDGDEDDAALTSKGLGIVLHSTFRAPGLPPPLLVLAPVACWGVPASEPNRGPSLPPLPRAPPV